MNWRNVVHEIFSEPGTKQWPPHGCWNESGPTVRPVPSSLGVRAMLCHPVCHLGAAVKVPVCAIGTGRVWYSSSQDTARHLHHALPELQRAAALGTGSAERRRHRSASWECAPLPRARSSEQLPHSQLQRLWQVAEIIRRNFDLADFWWKTGYQGRYEKRQSSHIKVYVKAPFYMKKRKKITSKNKAILKIKRKKNRYPWSLT